MAVPDADAAVNPTESFEDHQASVLDEVVMTGNKKEVVQ